jgi:hypothetical protein
VRRNQRIVWVGESQLGFGRRWGTDGWVDDAGGLDVRARGVRLLVVAPAAAVEEPQYQRGDVVVAVAAVYGHVIVARPRVRHVHHVARVAQPAVLALGGEHLCRRQVELLVVVAVR